MLAEMHHTNLYMISYATELQAVREVRGGGPQQIPCGVGKAKGDFMPAMLGRILLVASSSCRSSSLTF